MEYLKPVEHLRQLARFYQALVFIMAGLLAISLVAVPSIVKKENPVVINEDNIARIAEAEPWKVTNARMDAFTRFYLSSRFEWTASEFAAKKHKLKSITTDSVYLKFKESFSQFEILTQTQNAKCYYAFEGFGYSNAQKKIEAHVIRVLRVHNLAMATALTVRISYEETAVSATNPYGLIVNGVEESEVASDDKPLDQPGASHED